MTGWSLVYEGFDPAQERLRETLCTLGNAPRYRGHSLDLELTGDTVEVSTMHGCAPSIRVAVNDETYDLAASERRRFPLR